MTPKPDIYYELRRQINVQAKKLKNDISSGNIAQYACAMSPVSTIVHEIWIIAEDLATKFQDLDITNHADIISNPDLKDLNPPQPPLVSNFDYIHYALEVAVAGEDQNRKA